MGNLPLQSKFRNAHSLVPFALHEIASLLPKESHQGCSQVLGHALQGYAVCSLKVSVISHAAEVDYCFSTNYGKQK